MLGGGRIPAVLGRRDGADDEGTRRVAEGHGQEDHLVGGGRDFGSERSDDAPVAGSTGGAWLRGVGGSAQGETEPAAHPVGDGGGDAAPVSREVLRPEHAALPREASFRTHHGYISTAKPAVMMPVENRLETHSPGEQTLTSTA